MADITKQALRVEQKRQERAAQLAYLREHEFCNHPDRCIANNPKARLKAVLRAVYGKDEQGV